MLVECIEIIDVFLWIMKLVKVFVRVNIGDYIMSEISEP